MRQVQIALRTLMRSKGYSAVTVVTLAVAIGANTAMFSVLHSVLLRALPYPEPDRLFEIGRRAGSRVGSVTYPDYERWRDNAKSFSVLSAHFQNTGVSRVTLTAAGAEPESAQAAFVSASFFAAMEVPPRLGRVFSLAEEESGQPVAVLSDGLWRRNFAGADRLPPDADVRINGLGYRVIGVMPASFAWPARDTVVWIPVTSNRAWARRAGAVPLFRVVGRLAPGAFPSAARQELNALHVGDPGGAAGPIAALPLRPPLSGQHEQALYLLSAAVGLVLLIACANVASLTVARATRRAGEIALRVALGAGRARVAAELFVESILLAAVGAAAGLFLGGFIIDVLVRFRPDGIEQMEEAGLNGAVLAFSALATLLSALLFGLLPAWQVSGRDPIEAMRGHGRGAGGVGPRAARLRQWIVAGELALTVVLLSGSGLMLRSLAAASKVELGFDPRGAYTFRVQFPESVPPDRRETYFRDLFDRLRAMPQVAATGAIADLFELYAPSVLGLREIEDRLPEPRGVWTPLTWSTVTGGFFEAVGSQLLRGRWFDASDGPGSPPVAVIDENTARRYWPGEDPVGRRFKGQDPRGRNDDWVTVIGVVRNMRRQGLDREPTAHVYETFAQRGSQVPRDVVVRSAGLAPDSLGPTIRAVARSVDPAMVLSGVNSLEFALEDQLAARRFHTALLLLFALIAFALAAVGIYGVVSYWAGLRTREFGIRAVLGESRPALCLRMMRDSLGSALIGILFGLGGAALAAGFAKSLVFGVSPLDPVSLGGACILLALTVAVAAGLPAIRAAWIDPAKALRED